MLPTPRALMEPNVWAAIPFDRQAELAEVKRILDSNPRINAFLVDFDY